MNKKLVSFILTTCLITSFTACGGNDNPTSSSDGAHTHTFSETWTKNDTEHWKACTGCDEQKDKAPHDGSTCSVCGYQTQYENEIEKIHDLRIINEEEFTLVILPDEKFALIDPVITKQESVFALENYIPFEHDYDKDGIVDIDYLIVTSVENLCVSAPWFNFEVLNYYRPNIEIDLARMDFQHITSAGYQFQYERCYEEDLLTIPESFLSGRPLEYYTYEREISYRTFEGYYWNLIPTIYIASLYYANLFNVNTVPITSEASITNTFVYNGTTYSYSFNFLDLDLKINPLEYGGVKRYLIKNNHFSEDYYIDADNFDQQKEYSHMFTLTYQDFTMLYMGLPTENNLASYCERYGDSIKADLLISKYAYNDLHHTNYNIPISKVALHSGYDFPLLAMNVANKNNNHVFVKPTRTTNTSNISGQFCNFFTQTNLREAGALVLKDNMYVKIPQKKETECYRVNHQAQQSCEVWGEYSEMRDYRNWEDWK